MRYCWAVDVALGFAVLSPTYGLGYIYFEERDNPVYGLFLGG